MNDDLIEGVSPMCRRDEHHECVWFSYSGIGGLHREYWCGCECHGTATLEEIDLTDDAGDGADVPMVGVETRDYVTSWVERTPFVEMIR